MLLLFHSRTIHCLIIILFCPALLSIYPDKALGREDKLIPSIHLRQEYTDNLFMTADDETDDFILTASPGLRITTRTERLKLNMAGHFDSAWYHDHAELNGNDMGASGRLSYDTTEKLSLSANGDFSRDSRPDRDLDDTGLVLDTTRRNRYQGGVGGNYLFSERTSTNISSSYSRDDYQSKTDDPNNFYSYSGGLGVFHRPARFNQKTTLFCNAQYSQYQYETSTVDYYSMTAGAENQFTETLSIRFDLGGRYTVSEFLTSKWILVSPPFGYQIALVKEKKTNFGGVGQISLNYHGEFIHCTMSAGHDIQPASGRDGSSERTSMMLSFNKRFTEEIHCRLDGGYFFNNAEEDEFSSVAIDEETLRSTATFRYVFNRISHIETGYSFTRIKDNVKDTEINRNLVFINYQYNFEINL
ncbi:MAG: outer membrane beta-barrel protein [Pseudomonadota bacterium]